MKTGWIYALRTDAIPCVKIGLTTTSPAQRISEINASPNYGPHGPWYQIDVRVVRDVATVETALHRQLADRRSTDFPNTRELFNISPQEARAALDGIPDTMLAEKVPIDKLRLRPDFMAYLLELFRISGLSNFRDLQEAWTFTLFPSTAGGRFFTLNIDRHEVAFSHPLVDCDERVQNAIVVDAMVKSDRTVRTWLKRNDGRIRRTPYTSSWGNSVVLDFQTSFDESLGLMEITGFRRALVAYWYEALLRMRDKGTRSLFARFHNYDATSEIFRHLSERNRFLSRLPGRHGAS